MIFLENKCFTQKGWQNKPIDSKNYIVHQNSVLSSCSIQPKLIEHDRTINRVVL